jgi:hypothetical protein
LLAHCIALTNPKAIIFSKSLYPALSEVMPTLGDKLGPDLKLYCIDGSLENTEVFDLPSKLTTASAEPRKERIGKSFEGRQLFAMQGTFVLFVFRALYLSHDHSVHCKHACAEVIHVLYVR